MEKPFYKSRTFWVNMVAFVTFVITLSLSVDFLPIKKEVLLFIESIITAASNIWLRGITTVPLEKFSKTVTRALGPKK